MAVITKYTVTVISNSAGSWLLDHDRSQLLHIDGTPELLVWRVGPSKVYFLTATLSTDKWTWQKCNLFWLQNTMLHCQGDIDSKPSSWPEMNLCRFIFSKKQPDHNKNIN
jgi:hypothetical protein